MPLINAVGTLEYNEYRFDGATHVTVNTEFVQDEAQRTVLYHRITLTARTIIAVQPSTDQTMEGIRCRLGQQGKTLIFINEGFGDDLVVNHPAGTLRDVKWGPAPKILNWTPIGSCGACEVEWQVVTCIPVCCSSQSRVWGVMAINFGADYTIDARGYTTRTITGYLEIAQTRGPGNIIPDCADGYRDLITPTVPVGFRRSQKWTTSLDKSRLDFTITDEEIGSPNAWPPGVVSIEGRHRVRWSRGREGGYLRNALSHTIEMEANQQASTAYAIWLQLALLRLNQAINSSGGVLIDELSVDENIYGRDASFSVGYRVTSPLERILLDTGLWQPTGDNWAQWHFSMGTAFDQRGMSQLELLPANDAIVDLCGGSQGTIPWNTQQSTLQSAGPSPNMNSLRNYTPDARYSWLLYKSYVMTTRERPVVRQAILQTRDPDAASYQPNDTYPPNYGGKFGTDDILQEGGRSRYSHLLIGAAKRVGYPIPRPVLTAVGPSAATEVSQQFVQTVEANALGIPIYSASWAIKYYLENSPATVRAMENVKEIADGIGTARPPY